MSYLQIAGVIPDGAAPFGSRHGFETLAALNHDPSCSHSELVRQRFERRLTHDPIEEEVEAVKGYSDFVNGTLCFFVGVIWVAVTCQFSVMAQLMPDQSVGVAIILVPFGVLAVAGAFLIARFRIKNLR